MALPISTAVPQHVHSLYSDHHGWLKSWLRKRLGCHADAADLAHDTFVRLMVSGREPAAGNARPYLAQIARHLIIDQLRRRRIELAYLDTLLALPEAEEPSPEARILVVETLMQIDAMLDRMPTKVRTAFLLSQFEHLGYADIAVRLGVSVSSVQKYMIRAIQACHQVLLSE